jgi:protein-S-isoprenylcysteine O-methyltransferase Ste14
MSPVPDRPWLVAAVWLIWAWVTVTRGYAPTRPDARIDRRATALSTRADAIAFAALLGGIAVAVIVPAAGLVADPYAFGVGIVLVASGIAVRQWAARTLGAFFTRSVVVPEAQAIVDSGPYRWVRHPAYAGDLLAVAGLGLVLGNWLSLGIMLIGFGIASQQRVAAEEAVLEAHFGGRYRAFAHTRKRLLPGVW